MKALKKCMALIMMVAMMASVIGVKEQVKADQVDYTALAKDISLNDNWTDYWITQEDDTEQWYRINVPSDGKVNIKIMAYMKYMYYNFYNADLTKEIQHGSYFDGTETAPQTNTIQRSLSAGTYYLKITKDGNNAGKYRLSGTFTSYEANDKDAFSFDSPQNLPENTVITGALTETDKEDWYRITIATPGNYTVKTVSYQRYLDFFLYNSDMTKTIKDASYYNGSDTAPATKTFDVTLGAGTYYIKMTLGDYGKYLVSWSRLTEENCTHDYDSNTVYATFLAGGYTQYVCKKCGHTYRDNYTAKLVLNTPYFYSLYKTKAKKSFVVYYGSVYSASGYQIRYTTDRKMKKGVKVKSYSTYGVKTIKKLKRRKKYYVQVRAYVNVGGKKIYSKWSGKKSVKTR